MLGTFSQQFACNRTVSFQPFQNVAHEEHLEIIWCKNNDSLRKGKKKDGFYESSLSAGRGPSGAGLVITLLYLL